MLKFTYLFFASGRSFLIHLKGGICGIRKARLLFLVKIVSNSNGSTVCMSYSAFCMSSKSYAKFLEKNNRIDLCDYHSFCVFGGIYLRNKGTKLNMFCENISWKNVTQNFFPSMYSKNGINYPFFWVFLSYLKLKILTEIFHYNYSFYNNLPI